MQEDESLLNGYKPIHRNRFCYGGSGANASSTTPKCKKISIIAAVSGVGMVGEDIPMDQ